MPKVVDHDVRRAELVSATWRVLAEEGLEAATVRRIAQQADCTTGRVTHYFRSKDDILVAALREVHRAAADRMVHRPRGRDPIEDLQAVLLEALPLDEERRLEWRVWLAFWGRAAADDVLRSEQARRYAEWRALLATLIAEARPHATADDRRDAVDLISAAIDGLGVQAVLEPNVFEPSRLDHAVDTLLARIAHDDAEPAPRSAKAARRTRDTKRTVAR